MDGFNVSQPVQKLEGRISNLSISPTGEVALFSVAPEFQSVERDFYYQNADRVESLNVRTGEIQTLASEDGSFVRSYAPIVFDLSGQVALVQETEEVYYAVSPFNDFEPILIGSRGASFGFSEEGSEIVFRDEQRLFQYGIESGESTEIELDSSGFIQDYIPTAEGAVYSSLEFVAGNNRSYVNQVSGQQEPELIWSNSNHQQSILRSTGLSNDLTILSLQLNPPGCSYDSIRTNSQCRETQTALYDIEADEEIGLFPGFDLIWLP